MLITDEEVLAEIACIEPISVHGLLGIVNLGDNFVACYYRWRAVRVENGVAVREKMPAVTIIRPNSSVWPGGALDTWLRAQPSSETAIERLLAH